MTGDDSIEPNEIADIYQALSEYHDLVSRLADAREHITGETDSTLAPFRELIGEKRAEFGEATANRNPFTMQEYRNEYSGELPTIRTEGLTLSEREPFERLGIIESDESFRLPYNQRTGERIHIWPKSPGLNPDYDIVQEFSLPGTAVTFLHISDTHLGYQNRSKRGGGGTTEWVSRTDSLTRFRTAIIHAINEDVDAVVHTGDLFDHDVDNDTLEEAVSMIRALQKASIPFYFILGDHDRLAAGGDIPDAANAVRALQSLSTSDAAIHCTTSGKKLGENITLFGVDATGIGFTEIQRGYDLRGWSPADIQFNAALASETNIVCLHESLDKFSLSDLKEQFTNQVTSPDLILLGHEHSPPFDGDWQTTVDGVSVACAGPTVPISRHFDDHTAGYNCVQIDTEGNFGVRRRELS